MPDNYAIRQKAEGRIAGLRRPRSYWVPTWRECAKYTLPHRYRFLETAKEANGPARNSAIVDSTAKLAARTLMSGLLSGLTNPATPWFKFEIKGFNDEGSDVVLWLAECTRRMQEVFQESNYYNAMATLYFDIVVFGTAAMLIYDDFDDVIRCYNPCLGEFYLGNSPQLRGTIFAREYAMDVDQLVIEFGKENCSDNIKALYDRGGEALAEEVIVEHLVEPNSETNYQLPKIFKYRECYWEKGSPRDKLLRIKGYRESPGIYPRWALVGNDAYGDCPAMDALGDNKQLQQETKRKSQAIDKMVTPPMRADVQLKNHAASLMPGGITFVNGFSRERPGIEPIINVMPPVAELKEDIHEIQDRIRRTFFNNLFTDISNLETVRTAEEIMARREEKLIMLPVIKRLDNEALAPSIERTWAIMERKGLFPPPPRAALNSFVGIRYTSPFAMAMRAAETTAIERAVAFGGNLAGIDPTVMDNYNLDDTIRVYNAAIGADPRILSSDERRKAIRDQRSQQAQRQALLENASAAVQGANVLSQTEVGGGQNALQRVLGQ